MELLDRLGADVDQAGMNGATPTYIAAQDGHSQCIKVLRRLGADVNKAKNDGATPSQIAGRNCHPEVAELINRLAEATPPHRASDPRPENSGKY